MTRTAGGSVSGIVMRGFSSAMGASLPRPAPREHVERGPVGSARPRPSAGTVSLGLAVRVPGGLGGEVNSMLLKRRGVMQPGWHPDPTGRHQYREWNGVRWTEHVSDYGRPA